MPEKCSSCYYKWDTHCEVCGRPTAKGRKEIASGIKRKIVRIKKRK